MSFFEELKRRNVFKVGIAYAVAAWLLLQLTEVLTELLELNTDVGKVVIVLLVVGFIPALIFAWAFEMTPEGIKRESEVDRSRSVTRQTGQKLNIAVIVMLALIAGYFIWESRFKTPGPSADTASLSPTEDAPSTAASGPEGAGSAASSDAADPQANAIAVLPFANRSNVDEDRFFTDGIHDDLLTQLAKIDDLKVISRTSVLAYRDTTARIPEIAAELGVGKILEGGVQRAGDRVRINAQLVDVATDEHIWAETFDREMTIENIFDIQSEITRQIVNAVRGELTETEQRTLDDRPTDSLAAWESFAQAQAAVRETDYEADKYRRAEPFAQRATELDPEFAEAWALLASIRMQGIWMGFENTPLQREMVRTALDRAIALAPDNPMVKRIRAEYAYRVQVNYARCLELLEEVVAATPGNAETFQDLGVTLRRLGRWEDAVDALERGLALDPLNGFAASTLAETLFLMRAFDRMETVMERWLAREPESSLFAQLRVERHLLAEGDTEAAAAFLDGFPGDPASALDIRARVAAFRRDFDTLIALNENPALTQRIQIFNNTRAYRLGTANALAGRMETARGHFERFFAEEASKDPQGRIAQAMQAAALAEAHAWLGETDRARAQVERVQALLPREDDHLFGGGTEARMIRVLAQIGERDLALERIAARLDAPMGFTRWELHLDPAWDFFRDDPRFNELARPEGVAPEPFRQLEGGP